MRAVNVIKPIGLDNCLTEQRRFARQARWHYLRALNYSGDVAKYHHEQAEHLKIKAMAAHALLQLEISDLERSVRA